MLEISPAFKEPLGDLADKLLQLWQDKTLKIKERENKLEAAGREMTQKIMQMMTTENRQQAEKLSGALLDNFYRSIPRKANLPQQ